MKIKAWELNGSHVGKTVPVQVAHYGEAVYDGVHRKWDGVRWTVEQAEILMVTHKKNGDVRVRVSTGGDRQYEAETELVLS